MDGGVRKGTDVLKALALGARMVFVGRPAIWGLAYNGRDGVLKTLDILKKEFDSVMSLSGNTDVSGKFSKREAPILCQKSPNFSFIE